jgi:cytochrome c biogenesis protein CcmG/thiol:disulfide interchange protein DsbE
MPVTGGRLRWLGWLIAIVAVAFAVVLATRFGTDPGLIESPLLGKPAPEFDLATLDGSEQVSLSGLRGEIVVVNFFASWCLECRKEHADLTAASDAFADDGVRFVQISYQEPFTDSLAYLAEEGTAANSYYLTDPGSRTAIAYGVYGIPETFFINRDGVVVGKIIGETDALVLGAAIDAIQRGDVPGQQVTGDTRQQPEE